MATTQTYTCIISESWYASLEKAYIIITTPKGTSLRIDKWPPARFKHKWVENAECKKLVWRILVWRIYNENKTGVQLTKDEIMLLALHSNHQTTDMAWEWGH